MQKVFEFNRNKQSVVSYFSPEEQLFVDPIDISVVIPVYNEEQAVRILIERICKVLQRDVFEIVIVNDGSTDNTGQILQEISNNNTRVRYLAFTCNMGQSEALFCGFQHSRGHYVVMMDGDLQNPPEDIIALVDIARQGYDLVSGERNKRQDSFFIRKLPSIIANWFISKVMGCHFKDMGGMNCLRGDIARKIAMKKGYHRLIPAIVHCMGGKTTEVSVSHAPRTTGVSKYGFFGRSLEVILDVLVLWITYRIRPLYFFGKSSLLFFAFGIFAMLWPLTSKIVICSLVMAIVLFLVGIIGEFVGGSKSCRVFYDSFEK
ncbi:glycosyltransferase family 2 protein [Candidatus Uabimicrobium amorphum]|uniref:Dolichol-phosphate mannosyltransferase n=1 Tax=Uabimicrobium amorphum TaxID=2596890 RepID=A0A5S9F3Q6_UABAM|nr:glycosyltransferase family 2 protein [Candidatus Uabimicrobium amorphum]BBM84752.1 dolichol-phosphate mannosyltransferase [Candidatus Uabimicrobium amorphum]